METPPDWVTLTRDEQVVWSGPPSPIPYAVGTVVPLLLVLAGTVVFAAPVETLLPVRAVPAAVRLGAAGFLVLLGAYGVVSAVLDWYSRRYAVTTDEVYHKQGLVSRSVTNVRFEQIENTGYTQSALGRLLSYGDVRVATAGTDRSEVVFRRVSDPAAVVERITRRLDRV
ncbi:hypothetical protein BRD13_05355 [Halobacteriales archaeon SW_5_70_135]|nr:MAG: hypothetical protein BRD13_05355 [Halobacteriales archaeon SW_5_70_135]